MSGNQTRPLLCIKVHMFNWFYCQDYLRDLKNIAFTILFINFVSSPAHTAMCWFYQLFLRALERHSTFSSFGFISDITWRLPKLIIPKNEGWTKKKVYYWHSCKAGKWATVYFHFIICKIAHVVLTLWWRKKPSCSFENYEFKYSLLNDRMKKLNYLGLY